MAEFTSLAELRACCIDLPAGNSAAAAAVGRREAELTKPPRSLGRLEDLVAWLARWQGRSATRLDHVEVLAYAAEVTAQMLANFAAGGAAINQLARLAAAQLRVQGLSLEAPTADFTLHPAMDEQAFLAAVAAGYDAVSPHCDLVCLGEMGIGNTTAAAALAAALFGGSGAHWAGRGTGIDEQGIARKRAVIDRALARHAEVLGDPLLIASALGGRELAAILGAVLAARIRSIPVVLDGFVCTAAAAPLKKLAPQGLAHTLAGHVSAEAGHRKLLDELGLPPLLDLGMRLGEGSGAAVAVLVLRAALACHIGMATFAQAKVSKNVAQPPGSSR